MTKIMDPDAHSRAVVQKEELQLLKAFDGPSEEDAERMVQIWDRHVIQSKSPWISVKDRLPNQNEVVIISPGEYERVSVGKMCDDSWHDLDDHDYDGGLYTMINPPTHWMPLPEPPKP